jgi:lysophospholipase L1-like esterase
LVCLGVWGPTAGCTPEGARLADYDAAIALQCRARGGAFVVLSHVSDDGHPNDVGHRLVAELVLAAVSGLVAPVAGPG